MSSPLYGDTAQPYPYAPWPGYPHEGWLFDEDRALRDLMKGMVVTDYEDNQRSVEAWFGHPDIEIREQKYPYVTVDLLNIQEGIGRVHRGDLYIKDPPDWWGHAPLNSGMVGYVLEMPTPVDLDYQVATWSRNPRHDRQILRQLITGGRTMLRAGLLYTADHRIRRMDFQGHVKRDTVDGGKRLLANIFRVRISSEVPWGTVGPHQGAYGVRSIEYDVRSLGDRYGVSLDGATFVSGQVLGWDAASRTADVDLGTETAPGVPTSRAVYPDPGVGSLVHVSKEPKVPDPAALDDYNLLIIGVE
jgi:hypothetical protein